MLVVYAFLTRGLLQAFACYTGFNPSRPLIPGSAKAPPGANIMPLLRSLGTDQHRFGNLYIV